MKLLVVLILMMLAASCPAQAQQWAADKLQRSPRHMEWISAKGGKHLVKCFVAYPEVKDKATAVVVIHEIFGLTDWVREVCDQLAAEGFIAIAPDLLSGTTFASGNANQPGDIDSARKAISLLPPHQITSDLNAVTKYVLKVPSCNGRVAVAGFCWGGGQAFRLATNNQQIKASFVFYGTAPEQRLAHINCPIYGFYGENDARVTTTVGSTTELMKKAGKRYEAVIYNGAGHGFMRTGEAPDSGEDNEKARSQAWKRLKDLLQ